MPRIRYLKPEFFSDESLAEFKFETRLAYAGLWCYADKEGRLEDRPKYLKAMIFPYDNVDMKKQLDLLSSCKSGKTYPFIQRYEVEGVKLIQITKWKKHQKPHHTEKESIFPPIPPLKEKGMEKGMENQLNGNVELNNGEITVKQDKLLKSLSILKDIYLDCVFLTENEYQKLIEKEGEIITTKAIEILNNYKMSSGKKYKSDYHAILSWVLEKAKEKYDPNQGITQHKNDGLCEYCHKQTPIEGMEYCRQCTDYFIANPKNNIWGDSILKHIELWMEISTKID